MQMLWSMALRPFIPCYFNILVTQERGGHRLTIRLQVVYLVAYELKKVT